ncbi:hypothetical protein HOT63_gp082 [Salmonella phage S131]|uniref:Uncharacterized protein n=2 Tax=Tequintavirus S131 TaxID=2733989 RepID=A0A2Z5HNQ1_9CAUD|nr:hypothetical protein HOT63_gp082 [Salmonella phage S131]AXC41615.1 hypothetical protein [Salmonella phage S130]AXC41765.1 hypothetical protein [Salmonella phage S131]
MAIKINLPNIKNTADTWSIDTILRGTVYRNLKDNNCYIYQNELSGHTYIIESDGFCSFETEYEAKDHIQANDIPDVWKETNLAFVVSLEANK